MTKIIRSLSLTVAAALMFTLPAAIPSAAAHEPTSDVTSLELREPTGPSEVGSTTLHFTDRSRPDPWVPSKRRELMVSMYYPTPLPVGRSHEYMSKRESAAFIEGQREQGAPLPEDFPDGILSTTRTHVTQNALPTPRLAGRPLVLLSPGFSLNRASLTMLATELASNGYVVAAIDHPHESYGLELPGGRFAECAACDVEDYSRIPRGRSNDISFVLDRLLADRSPWRGLIDTDRIGMAGHSIGGNTSATVMNNDPRIDAGVNLDGTFFEPVDQPIDRPFMMLGYEPLHLPSGEDASWPRDWRKLTGPRYWLTVADGAHFTFTDYPLLKQQLGFQQPLPAERAVAITRAYVGAFFDRHLRGADRPLLDGPSEAFAEVDFHSPESERPKANR